MECPAALFEPGAPAREVALVVLGSAALPRRLARSQQWPSKLAPHEWQTLLVIALTEAGSNEEGAQTAGGIAGALSLPLDDVYVALDGLRRARLARVEFHDPQASEAEQNWVLTDAGLAAAGEVVAYAQRVIQWPPRAATPLNSRRD